MNPDMFWDATLLDVFLMIEGYRIREREAWRKERFTAYTFYCVMVGSEGKMSIEEFLRLPDDDVEEQSSEEDLMALYQKGLNAFKS